MKGELVIVRFFVCLFLLQFLVALIYGAVRLKMRLAAAVASGFKVGLPFPLLSFMASKKTNSMDLRVKAILRKSRIDRMVFAAQIMLGPFCIILALNILRLNMHRFIVDGPIDVDLPTLFGGSGLCASFCAVQACLTIIGVPAIRSYAGGSVLHCLAAASTSYTIFFYGEEENTFYQVHSWIVLVHLVLNVVDGEMWLVALLNATFAVLSACTAIVYVPGCSVLGAILYELTVFCISHGLALMVVSCREAMLRATLDAKMSRILQVGNASLLSSMCDAVMRLDSGLDIMTPSPQLAALLIRPASENVMQGSSFMELLENEDDQSLFLKATQMTDSVSRVIHTQFQDTNGSSLQVHLYHTRCLDVDGQPFHMVGIQEEDPVRRLSQNRDEVPDIQCVISRAHDEMSLSSGNSSDITVSALSTEQEEGISVWFYANSSAMEVLKCTPSFVNTCGSSYRKRPLLSCLRPIHEVKFLSWMQHALNRACHGLPVRQKTFKFVLPNHTLRLSATVVLDNMGLDDSNSCQGDGDDASSDIAKLTLTSLGMCMDTSLDLEKTFPIFTEANRLDAMLVTPSTENP